MKPADLASPKEALLLGNAFKMEICPALDALRVDSRSDANLPAVRSTADKFFRLRRSASVCG
ncbi:MAG: hypothetical protein JEZ11_06910 [Desulfobacterales bacterium]|nr:hypothetical protein [Desulfobacterales bacterium]